MKKKYTKRINLELNLLDELNYKHIYTDTITTNSELYFYTNYGCVKIVLLPNLSSAISFCIINESTCYIKC